MTPYRILRTQPSGACVSIPPKDETRHDNPFWRDPCLANQPYPGTTHVLVADLELIKGAK